MAQPNGNPGAYNGGDFYSITAGLNYTPNCNVIVRPEVRYDSFHGQGRPFADGTEREMFYYGMGSYGINTPSKITGSHWFVSPPMKP